MVDYGSLFDHVKNEAETKAKNYRDAVAKSKQAAADKHAAMMKPLIDKVDPVLDDATHQLGTKGVMVRRNFIDRLVDRPDRPTNMIHFQLIAEKNIRGNIYIFKVDGINAAGMYLENEEASLSVAGGLFSTHIQSIRSDTIESVVRRAVEEIATKIVDEREKVQSAA